MKTYCIGNLKMNFVTLAERNNYLNALEREVVKHKYEKSSVVLCPPIIHLESFAEKISEKNISLGVQNIFSEDRGSYTGETSALMAKNFGADFVIVGHSERRKYFHETNDVSNEKILAALDKKMKPIYCIGETQEERNNDQAYEVMGRQLREGLMGYPVSQVENLIIAYEPVWAVGSDVIPSVDEILEARIFIKRTLVNIFEQVPAEKIAILYGGSVKAKWLEDVCIKPQMDGVLIGRESLVPIEFLKIADEIEKNT